MFCNYDLGRVLTNREQELANEVTSLDEERILGTPHEDLCDFFASKYILGAPKLDESAISQDYGDARVDVSHRIEYAVPDRSRPLYVTGSRHTFYVPFEGDPQLFKCQASTYSLNAPHAEVGSNELVFVYKRTTQDAPSIEQEFERDRKIVQDNLGWIAHDVEKFNSTLREKVSHLVSQRREKLLRDRELVAKLGFPLRRNQGTPTTFVAPDVKRRIVPRLPPVTGEPFRPELELDMDEYEFILSILSNMVMVMERSPKAFKNIREEDLRTHFLMHLNGHYEGQATGETFNYEGKTDILVRVEGKNIFIAECKFWNGPSGLRGTLDQLLRYASWRDTKTAVLLFNRDRDMTTVLDGIPKAVTEHASFKRELPYDSETGFRYVFAHRDDPNRELTLTVLAFDVPA